MDKNILVERDVEHGKRLVESLRNEGFPIQLASWVRRLFETRFILCIASPQVQAADTRILYRLVAKVLKQEGIDISLSDIYMVATTGLELADMQDFAEIVQGDGLSEQVLLYKSPKKLVPSHVDFGQLT